MIQISSSHCLLPLTMLLVFPVAPLHGQDMPEPPDSNVTFATHVRPLLTKYCYRCHSGTKMESGLRLDIRKRAFAGGDSGPVIVPGDTAASELWTRIKSSGDERMPPEGERFTDAELAIVEQWIVQGADWPEGIDTAEDAWENHWSWQPLRDSKVPPVAVADVKNEIDIFVLRQLRKNSVQPAPAAERPALIRRVYLDVLGLAPSPEQWRRWMKEPSPEWYAMLVDELLSSPHYGERWGRIWLDQARYADSDGYEKDRPRPNAWLFRDWVIDALNDDLPFDQFSIQQLAGDLLPDATPRIKSATGFHRNTLTNNEGGIDREEDRVKQTVDRLNTTFTVWMGLTVQCAQCHTHKYDPISHREYYQLYSFFNDADEANVPLDPSPAQQLAYDSAVAAHDMALMEKRSQFDTARTAIGLQQPKLGAQLMQRFPDGVPSASAEGLVAWFPFDGESTDIALSAGAGDSAASAFQGPGNLGLTAGNVGDTSAEGAISLDGSGQHLTLSGVPGFRSDQAFSISVWIRPTDNLGAIVTKIDEPSDFRGIDFTNNRGLLEIHLVDKWPENAIKVTPESVRLKVDKWQHVLCSYDGSRKASGVRIFVDGQAAELTVQVDALTGDFTTTDPWRVGRRKAGTFLKASLDDLRIYDRVLKDAEVALVAGDSERLIQALKISQTPVADRTADQVTQLQDYFIAADERASALRAELSQLEANPPTVIRDTAMAMAQRNPPRETHVHLRGEFLNKGVQVDVGTPTFLPKLTARDSRPDRLDLARWMFGPARSLSSRVFVNRIWQTYFGRGLVVTDGDFGTQGDLPTHPELLDWLASDFIRSKWRMKHLHRTILLSATYQQSSHFRSDLQHVDPGNALIGFQPRLRVSAETVRDLALSAGGLLDTRIKGPSVFPPLPPGVIELAFVDVINRGPWKESTGPDRYRRGLYTFFQRTSPYPMLTLFDAPDSNVTCTRREKSNTPLQALTMWNDAVLVQSAQHLALRLLSADRLGKIQPELLIRQAFHICFSREPDAEEVQVALQLLQRSRAIYETSETLAANAAKNVELPVGVSSQEFGSWVSLARALMNLDEFITRP